MLTGVLRAEPDHLDHPEKMVPRVTRDPLDPPDRPGSPEKTPNTVRVLLETFSNPSNNSLTLQLHLTYVLFYLVMFFNRYISFSEKRLAEDTSSSTKRFSISCINTSKCFQ